MANIKYSYVFWGTFGVFSLSLWIGLYVGIVLPVQNSVKFVKTQCTTTSSVILDDEHNRPCPSETGPKFYPCIKIYVNYTDANKGDTTGPIMTYTQLYFTENLLQNNCSYKPYCEKSQLQITAEVFAYLHLRVKQDTLFPCHYNRDDHKQVIDANYDSRRLIILLPFTMFFLTLILAVAINLYRRGCGCNKKRRPSRLSFLYAVDEC